MIIKRIKRKILNIFQKREIPCIVSTNHNGNRKAIHLSAFTWGNAGDALLPVILRDLFSDYINVGKWTGIHVHKVVNNKDLATYEKNDLIVIGGGGLFLCDTNRNNLSGWQWSCSIDKLSKINKPIIGFAIGYNRFRGQEDFQPIFRKHLNMFVEKAIFVGIRNHGSIEKLKGYLDTNELKAKLLYQPCMTTLISHIYPTLLDYKTKENYIGFNCAFDRKELRASDYSFLYSIANVALELSKVAEIRYYSHVYSDKDALPYFDKLGVPYTLVEFRDVKQIIKEYSKSRLIIGMRGHAQMIPFGCLTPILSIVSHDKMRWFLDDIQHPEWGIDVNDTNFESELKLKAIELYNRLDETVAELVAQQERLWNITMDNMKKINKVLDEITPPSSPKHLI